MSAIVLATINARYSHASHALRCLQANLGSWREASVVREFVLTDPSTAIAEAILAEQPRLVGLSCAIWNIDQTLAVARILRLVDPKVRLVAGGPDVGRARHPPGLAETFDCLVAGEAELVLPTLVADLLAGRPVSALVQAPAPDLAAVALPYDFYSDQDLAHRLVYAEFTRGCPHRCAFCQSAQDHRLRRFPSSQVFAALDRLLQRGATTIKLLDRSLDADRRLAAEVLDFLLERVRPGVRFHAEMVPEHLDDALFDRLARFPAGSLHVEVGVQSLDPAVLRRIGRHGEPQAALAAIERLRRSTAVEVHADLLAGLPGEGLAGIATGFDRLWHTRPHEIQLGILKRLRDSPLDLLAEDPTFDYRFNPQAPYELLASHDLSFAEVQEVKRIARAWELFANTGQFRQGLELLLAQAPSPFSAFACFVTWLRRQGHQAHGLSLRRQCELLAAYLIGTGHPEAQVHSALAIDFAGRADLRGLPTFLQREVARIQRDGTRSDR